MNLEKGCWVGVRTVVVLRASLCQLSIAGLNEYGQVGDGNINTPVLMPTAVVGTVSSWSAISAGGYHTCGLAAANGQAYCWGEALCIFEVHWRESTSATAGHSLIRAAVPAADSGRAACITVPAVAHRLELERASWCRKH